MKNGRLLITDIQRYSVHDGPGIRTVVFFKGCPLRCIWCQNPETQSADLQLAIEPESCIGCGTCLYACTYGAAYADKLGVPSVRREVCVTCGSCVESCFAQARRMTGREMLAEDIADAVERDKIFYKNTGGGVTLSGGEPLAQPIQATSLLSLCKERGISSVVETSGYGNTVDFEAMLEYTDVLLFDIKHMDTEKHKRYTGKDNSLIIKHFLKAANMMHRGKIAGMVLRFPLVPGINDDEENVGETARLAAGAGVKEIHILGFHQAGKAKWRSHGMKYRLEDMRVAGMEEICQSKRIFEAARLNVSIGGGGK